MTDLWKLPMPKLVDLVDAEWSHYIRLRDSTQDENGWWNGYCFTCGKLIWVMDADKHWNIKAQCGHFITRENMSTRFNDENTHLQCEHCNVYLDTTEMLESYEDALIEKYGSNVIQTLMDLKNIHGLQKYGRAEIIDAYKYAKASVSDMIIV